MFSSTRVEGPCLRQGMGGHGLDLLCRERLPKHLPNGRAGDAATAQGRRDRVSQLDHALDRRALEPAPAGEHALLVEDEEPRAPADAVRIFRHGRAHDRKRFGKALPVLGDLVATERTRERLGPVDRRVEQRKVGHQEPYARIGHRRTVSGDGRGGPCSPLC